jgi:hypothetical protein
VLAARASSVRPWGGDLRRRAWRPYGDGRAGFDRTWIVGLITAAITASAGLAVARPLTGIPAAAAIAEMAGDTAAIACGPPPMRGGRVDR